MKHDYFKCTCNQMTCQFCEGGLGWCKVCDGFEGTLPSECPGFKMTEEQKEKVWKGPLDWKDGSWCLKQIS